MPLPPVNCPLYEIQAPILAPTEKHRLFFGMTGSLGSPRLYQRISTLVPTTCSHVRALAANPAKNSKATRAKGSERLLWLHASAWQAARAGGWLRLKRLLGRQKSTKLVLFHISAVTRGTWQAHVCLHCGSPRQTPL